MRVAILSDIHGNLTALESVLRDLEQQRVDGMVCLGDVASDGPQPREVLGCLMEASCPTVRGNMDAWLLEPHPFGGDSENAKRGDEIRSWCVDQLTSDEYDYLRSFQPTLEVSLDIDTCLLCYHGSPRSCEEGIFSFTPDVELSQMLEELQPSVFAGGHTHTQMYRRWEDRIIINPGSVGVPSGKGVKGRGNAWAEYAILVPERSTFRAEMRRVSVDVEAAADRAQDSGMPHATWWIQNRYGSQ